MGKKKVEWIDIHGLASIADAGLSDRQNNCFQLAGVLMEAELTPMLVLFDVNFDMIKAQELADKIDSTSKLAEYLDNRIDDGVDIDNTAGFIYMLSQGLTAQIANISAKK